MKKIIMVIVCSFSIIGLLTAQDLRLTKSKFGTSLGINILGLDNKLGNLANNAGFYYERNLSYRTSIYSELTGSMRNFRDVALLQELSGEFKVGNIGVFFGPMFHLGKNYNISLGYGRNFLINPRFKTTNSIIDIKSETTNYSSLFFDFRKSIYKEISLSIRYERGLNSIFHSTEKKVNNLSFNTILQLRGKSKQERNNPKK